jgi:lipopolysaccharide assembly outer membrane protein LptD (OstA)
VYTHLRTFLAVLLLILIHIGSKANAKKPLVFKQIVKSNVLDTIPNSLKADLDSIPSDSLIADSIKGPKVPYKKDLKTKVEYTAKDSIVYSVDGKMVYLYGDAVATYGDINLSAEYIQLNQQNFEIFAKGVADSTGAVKGSPIFEEGGKKYETNEIIYNFKTKIGKIKDVYTIEGEGYLQGEKVKKTPEDELYVYHGKYSTCNLKHPHFYININKSKVTKKRIVTGPAYLVVEDVPLPLALPFGFFPKKTTKSSGIIIPQYGEDRSLGFFFRDGGYYFTISDYMDLALRGTIYTNGSYMLGSAYRYALRYKFNGNLNLKYSLRKLGEPETPSFQAQRYFFVTWQHNQDPKASLSSRFSANVNAGSSRYLKDNTYNVNNILQNDLNSSINYSKNWIGKPYSMSIGLNHNQNVQAKTVNLVLPNTSFNLSRLTPLQSKSGIGETKWYQNLGLSYAGRFKNQINTFDSLLFTPEALKDFRNGINHSIPVTLPFKTLKYVNVNPQFNYNEYWSFSEINKSFNGSTIVSDTVYRFLRGSDLYGMFNINKMGIVALRHVFNPSISYSLKPDFSEERFGYFKKVQSDTLSNTTQYSRFEHNVFGGPSVGKSSSLGVNLGNNLEMKVKSKADTITNTKKITLLQSFNVNGSYNFAIDSFNLSNININARTQLFDKINLDFTGSFDPYVIDKTTGRRVNALEWETNNRPARFKGFTFATSGSLNPSLAKRKITPKNEFEAQQLSYINTYPENFVDFNIPYNFNYTYSVTFNADQNNGQSRYTQSLLFSGDVNVTKNWKIGFNSGYNLDTKEFTPTQLNIYRDLHCWDLSINWIPFGTYQSYRVDLKVKASILQDLKLTRRKDFYNDY